MFPSDGKCENCSWKNAPSPETKDEWHSYNMRLIIHPTIRIKDRTSTTPTFTSPADQVFNYLLPTISRSQQRIAAMAFRTQPLLMLHQHDDKHSTILPQALTTDCWLAQRVVSKDDEHRWTEPEPPWIDMDQHTFLTNPISVRHRYQPRPPTTK